MTKKQDKVEVNEGKQAIIDQQATEFLGEEVKDGKVVEEKNEVEEEAEKVKKERESTTEEEFDLEKLSDAMAEKAAEKMLEKTKAIREDENLTKEEKDKKLDELASEWQKEGRNPKDYDEIRESSAQYALKLFEKKMTEEKAKQEEESKAREQDEKLRLENFNKDVDTELEDLYASGKLPRVKDENDPNDVGKKSREALFKTMLEVNNKLAAEGKKLIYSPKIIFYEHYKPVTDQPAGADAPVAGGSKPATEPPDGEYSYNEIRNKSFFDFFRK